jgi:hypothetical protein
VVQAADLQMRASYGMQHFGKICDVYADADDELLVASDQ